MAKRGALMPRRDNAIPTIQCLNNVWFVGSSPFGEETCHIMNGGMYTDAEAFSKANCIVSEDGITAICFELAGKEIVATIIRHLMCRTYTT